MPREISLPKLLLIGLLLLLPALLLQSTTAGHILKSTLRRAGTTFNSTTQQAQHLKTSAVMTNRTPVYFLSHGGPNIVRKSFLSCPMS